MQTLSSATWCVCILKNCADKMLLSAQGQLSCHEAAARPTCIVGPSTNMLYLLAVLAVEFGDGFPTTCRHHIAELKCWYLVYLDLVAAAQCEHVYSWCLHASWRLGAYNHWCPTVSLPPALLPYNLQMKETALIRAAHNGHLAVVEHLLQSGADIAARDLVSTDGPLANEVVLACAGMLLPWLHCCFCCSWWCSVRTLFCQTENSSPHTSKLLTGHVMQSCAWLMKLLLMQAHAIS